MISPLRLSVILGITVAGCGPSRRPADSGMPPAAQLSATTVTVCLDSAAEIAFSNVAAAPETKDLSGFEFAFARTNNGWRGTWREAAGEPGLQPT